MAGARRHRTPRQHLARRVAHTRRMRRMHPAVRTPLGYRESRTNEPVNEYTAGVLQEPADSLAAAAVGANLRLRRAS